MTADSRRDDVLQAARLFRSALDHLVANDDDPQGVEQLRQAAALVGQSSLPARFQIIFERRHDIEAEYRAIRDDLHGANLRELMLKEAGLPLVIQREDERPLVTMIVRTFNRPASLMRCLQSLAAQTLSDFDVVVVNDAGQPVSDQIERFAGQLDLRLVTHPVNRGRPAALNSGLAEVRGEYVGFVDDDDLLYPGHLEMLVGKAQETSGQQVMYSDALAVHAASDGTPLYRTLEHSKDFDRRLLLVSNFIPILSALVPVDAAREAGPFDTELEVLEDWDWWLRLAGIREFQHVPAITAEYRLRGGGDNSMTQEAARFDAMLRRVYSRHPAGDEGVADARAKFLRATSWRRDHYPVQLSVLVCAGEDPGALLRLVEQVAVVADGVSAELVLDVPEVPGMISTAQDLKEHGSVAVSALHVDLSERHASLRRRAVGRNWLLCEPGASLSRSLIEDTMSRSAGDGIALTSTGS